MTSVMSPFLQLQQTRNSQTRDGWHLFTEHRQQVMNLLRREGDSPTGWLCLLGAGNCNDVDLQLLQRRYSRIDLVDWDRAALIDGVGRQLGTAGNCVQIQGGIDFTAIADELARWCEHPPSESQIDELGHRAEVAELPEGIGQADTAASLCVLSQLIELCSTALGRDHPRLPQLVQAVRRGHLRQLAGRLRPGGTGVVVTDLVSSDTAPDLMRANQADLSPLVHRLLSQGNFFLGLHPMSLLEDFRTDGQLQRMATLCNVGPPWLWQMGPRRFVVYSIVFRAPPGASPPRGN
jgi:hypothetical protein